MTPALIAQQVLLLLGNDPKNIQEFISAFGFMACRNLHDNETIAAIYELCAEKYQKRPPQHAN